MVANYIIFMPSSLISRSIASYKKFIYVFLRKNSVKLEMILLLFEGVDAFDLIEAEVFPK